MVNADFLFIISVTSVSICFVLEGKYFDILSRVVIMGISVMLFLLGVCWIAR